LFTRSLVEIEYTLNFHSLTRVTYHRTLNIDYNFCQTVVQCTCYSRAVPIPIVVI